MTPDFLRRYGQSEREDIDDDDDEDDAKGKEKRKRERYANLLHEQCHSRSQ